MKNSILPGYSAESIKDQGKYTNTGFGLYVLSEISKRFGTMYLGSYSKYLNISKYGTLTFDCNFPGTFIGIDLDYSNLLNNRKIILDIVNQGEKLAKQYGYKAIASASSKDV